MKWQSIFVVYRSQSKILFRFSNKNEIFSNFPFVVIFKFLSFFAAKRTRDPRESSREYGRKIQVEKTMERLSPLVFLLFLSAVNLFDFIWVSQQQSRCVYDDSFISKIVFFFKPHVVKVIDVFRKPSPLRAETFHKWIFSFVFF